MQAPLRVGVVFSAVVAMAGCGASTRHPSASVPPNLAPSSVPSRGTSSTASQLAVVPANHPTPGDTNADSRSASTSEPTSLRSIPASEYGPSPKIAGIDDDVVRGCERAMPSTAPCLAPNEAATAQKAGRVLPKCEATRIAEFYDCLCRAGGKPYCEFSSQQRGEIENMRQ